MQSSSEAEIAREFVLSFFNAMYDWECDCHETEFKEARGELDLDEGNDFRHQLLKEVAMAYFQEGNEVERRSYATPPEYGIGAEEIDRVESRRNGGYLVYTVRKEGLGTGDTFIYRLVETADGLRIAERKCVSRGRTSRVEL